MSVKFLCGILGVVLMSQLVMSARIVERDSSSSSDSDDSDGDIV